MPYLSDLQYLFSFSVFYRFSRKKGLQITQRCILPFTVIYFVLDQSPETSEEFDFNRFSGIKFFGNEFGSEHCEYLAENRRSLSPVVKNSHFSC